MGRVAVLNLGEDRKARKEFWTRRLGELVFCDEAVTREQQLCDRLVEYGGGSTSVLMVHWTPLLERLLQAGDHNVGIARLVELCKQRPDVLDVLRKVVCVLFSGSWDPDSVPDLLELAPLLALGIKVRALYGLDGDPDPASAEVALDRVSQMLSRCADG